MEFAGIIKENTHKNKKSKKCKYLAEITYYCGQCRGMCVFSKLFFEKYSKSKAIKDKIDEKFYPNDFDNIRKFFENESHCESKMETKPKLLDKDEEKSTDTTLDIFKKYHSLGDEKWGIGTHSVGSEIRRNKLNKYLNKCGPGCRYCFKIPMEGSRQKRNTRLISDSIADFRME